jgi:type IV secretion system protein TrbL
MGAIRAGTAMGSAASTAYRLGQETSGSTRVGAGLSGVARAGGSALRQKLGEASGLGAAVETGRAAALRAGSPASPGAASTGGTGAAAGDAPQWAQRLRAEQTARHHRQAALQAVREGDRGGAAAHPDIKEREE